MGSALPVQQEPLREPRSRGVEGLRAPVQVNQTERRSELSLLLHNEEAEQRVVGSLLGLDPLKAYETIRPIVTAAHFHQASLGHVFAAAERLIQRQEYPDVTSVSDE